MLATIRFKVFFLSYLQLVKNVEIKIHKTVIWLLFEMGVEPGLSQREMTID